jgi:hypothetical protein
LTTGEVTDMGQTDDDYDEGEPSEPVYENVLDTVGYKENYRLSGSTGEEVAFEGRDTTGFIPVEQGDYINLRNVTMPDDGTNNQCLVGFYNENKEKTTIYHMCSALENVSVYDLLYDEKGNLTRFRMTHNVSYIRICCNDINENSIIFVTKEKI